jgi:hypothetical protein
MKQHPVTAADILRQAERIGWALTEGRAADIAELAAPAYAAFERAAAKLDFDVDTLSLFAALQETRAPELTQGTIQPVGERAPATLAGLPSSLTEATQALRILDAPFEPDDSLEGEMYFDRPPEG